jgi:hypothetical protein
MIKRLPQFAEHHFASLCASAGVVCNSSDQDECGWDFFLQYPAQRSSNRPADMQPAGSEALVQVKSTRNHPLIARMKLSNALRMAQATQPCFVALVLEGTDVPRIYIRHFWKDEIERTLKRVRAIEREGKTEFHKSHFTLQMREVDARDDPLEWMRLAIEAVKPSYAAEKSRTATTVGHEDGFGLMRLNWAGTAQDTLDLQLGLIESLPISQVKFVPKRFGIEATKPEFEMEEATLFVTPVAKPIRLRLQGGSPTEEIFVDGGLYSAELPGDDSTLYRWRVDAGPLDIVGGSGSYKAKLSLLPEVRRRIVELKLILTMADWRGTGLVGLQLIVENQNVPLGMFKLDPSDDKNRWKELRSWATALHTVEMVAQSLDSLLSLQDLRNAEPWLSRFANFVMCPSIRIDYQPEDIDDPTRAAIYYVGCNVGEMCFLAVVERNTKSDEMDGTKRRVTFGPPQLLDAIVRRGSWRDYSNEIEAAYRMQIERLGKPETLWEIGELEAFINSFSREAV